MILSAHKFFVMLSSQAIAGCKLVYPWNICKENRKMISQYYLIIGTYSKVHRCLLCNAGLIPVW